MMNDDISEDFIEGLRQLGVAPERLDSVLAQFQCYRQELLDWNTRVNLTAITQPEEVLSKHFLDSLSLLQALPASLLQDQPTLRLLDIGSGAGFPGLPLKIVYPSWRVVLLEATGKKVSFLQHLIDMLELNGVESVHGRAEDFAHKREYRAAFDLVTARAVASLPTLLEYSAPFCRPSGLIVLPKKGDFAQELALGLRAAQSLGISPATDHLVTLAGLNDDRHLLVWKQNKLCPPQYPRSGNAMVKKPLGG
jgi:16S rRNA (guanine527-N7)-methyltransferase